MRAHRVAQFLALMALSLGITSCVDIVGGWQRFNRDFHYSYPLQPDGRISVETYNGSVDISGWDEKTVDISGTKYAATQDEADNLRIDIDHAPDSIAIRVPAPTLWHNNQGARFVIKIPRTANLQRVWTSNGSIRTADGAGPARLRTSNSSIRVTDLKGDLTADTSNSGIDLLNVEGEARVHTSNSSIHADRVSGSLDAVTSNSAVRADVLRADRAVHIQTSNSSVELDLPRDFASGVRVQTSNGSITLRMPEGSNASVTARTSNASITTDFAMRIEGERSKNLLDGEIGQGGPLIDLSTSNSGIRILRR